MWSKLLYYIEKVAFFAHISDGEGQLDIVDLSFIAIVVKMLLAPNFDWQAVCAMLPLIASQMHTNQLSAKQQIPPIS